MIVLSLFFQFMIGWSMDHRVLSFSEKEISVCGNQIHWSSLLEGISKEESECLGTFQINYNREINLQNIINAAESSNLIKNNLEEKRLYSLERSELIHFFKNVRIQCLKNSEILIPKKINLKFESQLSLTSLETWIYEQLKNSISDKKIEIQHISLPKVDCNEVKSLKWSNFKLEGRNQFRFMLNVNEKNYWVTGDYRWFQNVPVATKNIFPHEKLNNENIELQLKDTTFQTLYSSRIEDLIGRTVMQNIPVGSLIDSRHLKVEYLVEKGQFIQAQFQGENFVLSSQVQAEQSGVKGDLIKIKNLESQKILSAIVTGKGLVEVK